MNKKFAFSVIIPIYNVENYLAEAIDSIINQTVGFEEHIQIIMINDGSPDNSEEICLKYKNQYPDNIVYKKIANGGVSNARNIALDLVEGDIVTFLDPDDMWAQDAFEHALSFFSEHGEEVDVVGARIEFFEAREGYHILDYKFNRGTRVVNIDDETELYSLQSPGITTFIKASALKNIRFDTRLKYGEDPAFITKIIIKKRAYGLLKESLYRYRRRYTGDSAINNQLQSKSYYTDSILYFHMELIKESEALYGEVIPYVQAMVAYDLFWRIDNDEYLKVLTPEEIEVYTQRVKDIIAKIDDSILLNHRMHRGINKRAGAYRLKYGKDLYKEIIMNPETKQLEFEFDGRNLLNLPKTTAGICQVAYLDVVDNIMQVDILIARWLFRCDSQGEVKLKVKFGNQELVPELSDHDPKNLKAKTGKDSYYLRCSCKFDLSCVDRKQVQMKPYVCFGPHEIPIAMLYSRIIPNSRTFKPAYKTYGKYIIKCNKNALRVTKPIRFNTHKKRMEKECIKWLKAHDREDLAQLRKNLPKFKKQQKKNGAIWIFSDRIDNAGDSGEVAFKYICENKPENVHPIFTIGQDVDQKVIDRLKAIGDVVFFEDPMFKYYFLAADALISSGASMFTVDPFEEDRPYVADLFKAKFYFMNHGVNCGDCSDWLNKYSKDIRIFFNTGVNERQAIIDGRYYYTEDQCVITGLPRFDALYDEPQKQLLVLPSWRRSISGAYDKRTSSIYYDKFVETDYYKFYNSLINDERLLAKMREKGYKGLFCLHPIFKKQSVDFVGNDVFAINEGFINYNKVFAESSVMVTDYSTIAFDFAYLKKPIVYTQFDKEEFYENQTYDQGFFEYERDGFGPVCYNLDDAVNTLVDIIDKDCENAYIKRVTDFFVNLDKNNSKRVVDAVLADSNKLQMYKKSLHL